MGFFKNISLDAHAIALSKAFETIRHEHYLCVARNVQNALGTNLPPNKNRLTGEADLCLKGIQCLITMAFIRRQRYVSSNDDANTFVGCLTSHGWSQDRDAVSGYAVQFSKDYDDIVKLVPNASIPVTDYILGDNRDSERSAVVLNVASRTLSAFPSATKLAIASEFRDMATMEKLQREVEIISLGAFKRQ